MTQTTLKKEWFWGVSLGSKLKYERNEKNEPPSRRNCKDLGRSLLGIFEEYQGDKSD